MLWEEGDIWEEKEGEPKRERGEKKEEDLSAVEELFQSGRSHHRIPAENSPGKLLGEVGLGVCPSERRKFQELARG